MPVIYAIVAGALVQTGEISFKFMLDSGAPWEELRPYSEIFGVLALAQKRPDYVDPFRLIRSEPGAVEPDGTLRWNLNLIRAGKGLILGFGCAATDEAAASMAEQLRGIPNCVLLMDEDTFPPFEKICISAGIVLQSHVFNGVLRTS
jgi:hypothetical protein